MPVGPDRNKQVQRIVIRIDEVDISARSVHGYDKSNVLVVATWRETPNGLIHVPAQNERWIAQREGMGQWRLVGRLDSADDQSWIEANLGPGDIYIKAPNVWFSGTVHGAGGGGGSVNSVTAGDASIVIGGTGTNPTVETADLRTISSLHPTSGDVSMNSHKITNLTPGVAGTDAATVSQIPTSFPPSGAAGGDLTGTYPNPTIGTISNHGITFHATGGNDLVVAKDPSLGALNFTAAGWPYLGILDSTAGGAGFTLDSNGTDGTHQGSYEMYVPHADRGIHFFHDGTNVDILRIREDAGGSGLPGIVFGDTVTDAKLWRASAGVLASNASLTALTLNASGLTGATSTSRYVGATTSGAPASGTFAQGDFVIALDGGLWICTAAGSPGTWKETGSVGNLVTSVFGRTGAVVAATGDYSLTQINKGTQHRLVISGASTLGDFPAGSSGQLLQSAGSSADPAWTTATYPTTAGAAGHVPRSDGTNYVDAQLAATDLSNGTVGLGHVVLDNGPALINPTATTQATADNSTKVATTAYVQAQGYVTATTAPVTSVDGRTGAVTGLADLTSGSQQNFTAEVKAPDFTAGGLTGATAASRYGGATTSGPPTTGTWVTGDYVVSQQGRIWICVSGGTPGSWKASPSVSFTFALSGL